jgi:hypothetical protein
MTVTLRPVISRIHTSCWTTRRSGREVHAGPQGAARPARPPTRSAHWCRRRVGDSESSEPGSGSDWGPSSDLKSESISVIAEIPSLVWARPTSAREGCAPGQLVSRPGPRLGDGVPADQLRSSSGFRVGQPPTAPSESLRQAGAQRAPPAWAGLRNRLGQSPGAPPLGAPVHVWCVTRWPASPPLRALPSDRPVRRACPCGGAG